MLITNIDILLIFQIFVDKTIFFEQRKFSGYKIAIKAFD